MNKATKSNIHHFIKHTAAFSSARKLNITPHFLLIFDASGCVTKSDLGVIRSMVSAISADLRAEVSLICVNHQASYDAPYDPSESMASDYVHADSQFARDIDMLGVLVDRLCDPSDHYDGIVVMTEGKFPPFSSQALHDAVASKGVGEDRPEVPPIGFFLFTAGAIPADPAHAVTRHVTL